jgi:streptogramin lyase
VYPPGFRWSTHMKPLIGTELCMHGHVGFLAEGRVHGEYADGCVFEFAAPQVIVVEPGHDAWVVGREPAVLIQFDAAAETAQRFGLPAEHRHAS